MNWQFLRNENGEEDVILGTKFGDEIIGTLVLRMEIAGGAKAGKKVAKKNGRVTQAVIRAWTVRLRFRHKGVGRGLLEEAVRIAREGGGKDIPIGFSTAHANSTMVLWENFNGGFRAQQKRAVEMLHEVEREMSEEKRWRR